MANRLFYFDKTCAICQKPFETKRKAARYCSTACSGEARRLGTGKMIAQAQATEKLKLLKKGNELSSHNRHYVKSVPQESAGNTEDYVVQGVEQNIMRTKGLENLKRGGSTSTTPQKKNFINNGIQQSPSESRKWLGYFLEFISELQIDSKEKGIIPLKDSLYRGQWLFLEQVCAGLDAGCREFVVLKARQLGITTISLAMDLFWMFVHDGMQSGFVAQDEGGKEKTREILERYISGLPDDLKVSIVKHNRYNLLLSNGSIMDYLVAGTTKRTKSLGRGRAHTMSHLTEVGFYGNQDAVDSYVAGLAKDHPDRLRIWESTANGFDSPMWEKWSSAKEDTITQKCIFIGWWGNDTYDVSSNLQLMEQYGEEPNPDELIQIAEVKKLYNQSISLGQLAWYRWYSATQSRTPHMMMQEYPWTEEEAFISTGSKFFDQKKLSEQIQDLTRNYSPFKGYTFQLGKTFVESRPVACDKVADVTLRVWEKPVQGAQYIISCDPAFGSNDNKDNAAMQVKRCYADRLVQVAEYASHDPFTFQQAWVLAWLAGKYKNCLVNLEVSGPGGEVLMELKHLKALAQAGALSLPPSDPDAEARDEFLDNMQAARWYIWNRPDSMGQGFAYGWKTTSENKIAALNAMRDAHVIGALVLRSLLLAGEMQNIVQNGWDIRASGQNKDDRVMAGALAVWGWQQWIRPQMIAEMMTFERVSMMEKMQENPRGTFMQQIVSQHMNSMEMAKAERVASSAWDEW